MKVQIQKDSHGYLAKVTGYENIFAHGTTEKEAKKELLNVLEMMMDFHLEQVEQDRKIRNAILSSTEEIEYAV